MAVPLPRGHCERGSIRVGERCDAGARVVEARTKMRLEDLLSSHESSAFASGHKRPGGLQGATKATNAHVVEVRAATTCRQKAQCVTCRSPRPRALRAQLVLDRGTTDDASRARKRKVCLERLQLELEGNAHRHVQPASWWRQKSVIHRAVPRALNGGTAALSRIVHEEGQVEQAHAAMVDL
eukprot:3463608-Prymnesium_polylepis.2